MGKACLFTIQNLIKIEIIFQNEGTHDTLVMTLKGGPLRNFVLFFSLLGVNDQTLVEYLYCD